MKQAPVRSFNIKEIFHVGAHCSHVTSIETEDGFYLKLAGMLGFDYEGVIDRASAIAHTHPDKETVQALLNIGTVVAKAAEELGIHLPECHTDDATANAKNALGYLVATRVDVSDLDFARQVNQVYIDCQMPKVARTMVAVNALPYEASVQITAEAYLPKDPRTV